LRKDIVNKIKKKEGNKWPKKRVKRDLRIKEFVKKEQGDLILAVWLDGLGKKRDFSRLNFRNGIPRQT
jgi:hypothetical protein